MKQPWIRRRTSSVAWAWLLLVFVILGQTGIARAQSTPPMQLKITILDGEGSLNNIRERTAREPIVQVEDENHKPVAGALVLFTIHGQGSAGATFANSLTTYQTTTDAYGRAIAQGLRPNGQSGGITIHVTATKGPTTVSTDIHQVNVDPEAGTNTVSQVAKQPHHFAVTAANVAFVGVVAAVGAVLGWSAVTSGPSSTTITAGSGGVGPPSSSSAQAVPKK
jgi:hypothetical protein